MIVGSAFEAAVVLRRAFQLSIQVWRLPKDVEGTMVEISLFYLWLLDEELMFWRRLPHQAWIADPPLVPLKRDLLLIECRSGALAHKLPLRDLQFLSNPRRACP